MAEAEDLKSSKCGFDPHSGHVLIDVNRCFLLSISFVSSDTAPEKSALIEYRWPDFYIR